jgi:hypothetical protein
MIADAQNDTQEIKPFRGPRKLLCGLDSGGIMAIITQ